MERPGTCPRRRPRLPALNWSAWRPPLAVKPQHRVVKRAALRLAGLFNSDVRESYEMLYEHEYPYVFDSTNSTGFGYAPTRYGDRIRRVAGIPHGSNLRAGAAARG